MVDTARNIEAMSVDCVVVRHQTPGAAHLLAQHLKCPVINAGDGPHEHPTQGLLDIMTIREHRGSLAGLTVALIGDIQHSRTARSNIWGLQKLGAHVIVCGPSTLVSRRWEQLGVEVSYHLDDILPRCDVLNLLRIQFERQYTRPFPSVREYALLYAMNRQRLKRAKENILIMAPGPINRGVEITPDVADGEHSVILDQVTNGLAVRMAVALAGDHDPRAAGSNTMSATLLIRNGRIVDPSQHLDRVGHVLLRKGRIAELDYQGDADQTIDATGLVVAPGLIDLHAELCEPGKEEDETIVSGGEAALAGGFASICCMPNTDPPLDTQAGIEYVRHKAARARGCHVFVLGCVSKNREGKELSEIGSLVEAGAVGFTDAPRPISNPDLLRRALEYCLMFNKPILTPPEAVELTQDGIMHDGMISLRLGLGGMPSEAEDILARAISAWPNRPEAICI